MPCVADDRVVPHNRREKKTYDGEAVMEKFGCRRCPFPTIWPWWGTARMGCQVSSVAGANRPRPYWHATEKRLDFPNMAVAGAPPRRPRGVLRGGRPLLPRQLRRRPLPRLRYQNNDQRRTF